MTGAAGGVLALDLSTRTGWAYAHAGDPKPLGGTWYLPNMHDLGKCCAALGNELLDAIRLFQPSLVVYEAPLPIYDRSTMMQFGLATHVESECWREAIRCKSRSVNDARGAILGRSKFPPEMVKPYVMNWARAEGYDPEDDNHADALVLWRFETGRMLRRAA